MSHTINGLELYEKRKVKTALFGIFLGVISGVTGTLNGIINGITVEIATEGMEIPDTVLISMMMVIGVLGIVDVVNGIIMFIYNSIKGRGFSEHKRTLKLPVSWIMLGTAMIVGPFGQGLYYTGIVMCGATVASAIAALAPMITAILSRIIFKETLGARVFVGIAIIISGGISLYGTIIAALFSPSILPLTIMMGAIMAISYASIYGGFVNAGPGRTLAGVYTIPIWSIPVTLIMSIIVPQYCAFDLSLMTGVGACIVGVGAVLVVCKPSELVNLRDN